MAHWLDTVSPMIRSAGRGIRAFGDGWIEPRRVIYDHQLVLFDGGEFVVETDHGKHRCAAGTFAVIPPGLWHVTRAVGPASGSRYWVHFDWQYTRRPVETPVLTYHPATPRTELFASAPPGVPDTLVFGDIPSSKETFELHERLVQRWRFGTQRQKRSSRALLLEMLIELFDTRDDETAQGEGANRIASRTRMLLDRIASGPVSSDASIQQGLRRLGYSYAHQARLFKKQYGLSPNGYVQALRMTRARDLLRDTSLSVSEVAHRLGFENLHYFSRLFKQHEGVCARDFAASQR